MKKLYSTDQKNWQKTQTKQNSTFVEERKHAEEGAKQTIVVVRDKMPETPEVDCVKPEGND